MVTTNLSLEKPARGTLDWHTLVNGNMDLIDAVFAAAGNGTSVGLNVGAGKILIIAGTQTVTGTLNATGAAAVNVSDSTFFIKDNSDATKIAVFQCSGITTGTTRTYTLPDVTDTLVTLTAAQTLTNKTLTAPVLGAATATSIAIGGATIGSNALAITGTVLFNSTLTGADGGSWGASGISVTNVVGSTVVAQKKTASVATAFGCGGGLQGGFVFGASSSMTLTVDTYYQDIRIVDSNGNACRFTSKYSATTITLSADSDAAFVTAAPVGDQMQITKGTNANVITLTTGNGWSASFVYITCVGGNVTAITDPA